MILLRRIFQSNAAFGKWQCKEVFLSFAGCISVKLLFAFVWTENGKSFISQKQMPRKLDWAADINYSYSSCNRYVNLYP